MNWVFEKTIKYFNRKKILFSFPKNEKWTLIYILCAESVCTYDIALSEYHIVANFYSMITTMVFSIAMEVSRLIMFFVCSNKCEWKSFSRVRLSVRLDSPRNSPGQNSGVGSCSLLQGIFPTQWIHPGLLSCRLIPYQLRYPGSPVICVHRCTCLVCV